MFERLFKRKKEEVKREGPQIGDRFAVTYDRISTPLTEYEEHPYTSARIKVDLHNLNMGEIYNLWTVVEYIGDGQYLDLITEEIYSSQKNVDDVLDTVTPRYEQEALQQQEEMLEHPLAVSRAYSGYREGNFTELTPEIKKKIIEESMPRQEEIIDVIKRERQHAIELISGVYSRKNQAAKQRNEREEAEARAAREKELAAQRRQEEMRRAQEEREQAAQRLRAEVEPKFEELFPKRRVLTRNK